MMAALAAARAGTGVILLEKNPQPGKKLLLSGKGRCNLTNACDIEDFIARFYGNGQFLRDAFGKLFYPELKAFFESRGLKLKTERQQRVFPVSDRSASVLDVLVGELARSKVDLRCNAEAEGIVVRDRGVKGVKIKAQPFLAADAVVLATGGVSYAFTGSTGDGIRWAEQHGHRIIPLRPGLVALETKKEGAGLPEGLVLKNIRLTFTRGRTEIVSETGELLFTDFGVSGPLVLTLSGRVADLLGGKEKVTCRIDLKPALSFEQVDARLVREFKTNPRRNIRNVFKALLPGSLVPVFLRQAGLADKKANQVTHEERARLCLLLKRFSLEIVRTRPMREAMITRGGVSLKDIDPRTMESRLVRGLYFCGEMIDVAADTGGFNLQAAFSTGYLAGLSAAAGKTQG